jgi:hypothetical protein
MVLKGKTMKSGEKRGVPERIRTSDLWIRSPTLYPTELQARRGLKNIAENTQKRKEREGAGWAAVRSLRQPDDIRYDGDDKVGLVIGDHVAAFFSPHK